MGYLICDKCKGYYKLRPDESPGDFESCSCGGTLNYASSLKEKEKQKFNLDPRISRLILGVLIVLIPNFIFNSNLLFFTLYGIPLFLAGFVSSLFVEGSIKDGTLNGARVGLFSGLIYIPIALILFLYTNGLNFNITPDLGIVVLSFAILILITSFGGFTGVATRDLWSKKSKVVEIEEEKIVEPVRDPTEIKYQEKMVKLGYKEVSAITNGEKIFKDLLSQTISEEDAIRELKNDQTIANEVLKEMRQITPPLKYQEYHAIKMDAVKAICRTFEIIDGLVFDDQNKIKQTDELVECSTAKINEAISELNKTMQNKDSIDKFDDD